MPNHPL